MKFIQKTRHTPLDDARQYFNQFEKDPLYEAIAELLAVDAVPPVTRAPVAWTRKHLKEYLDMVIRMDDPMDAARIAHMRTALDHINGMPSRREKQTEHSAALPVEALQDDFWFLDLKHVKVATEVGSVEPVRERALGVLREFAGKRYSRPEAMRVMAQLVAREPYLGRTRELHVRLCHMYKGAIRRDIPYIFIATRGDNDSILYRTVETDAGHLSHTTLSHS